MQLACEHDGDGIDDLSMLFDLERLRQATRFVTMSLDRVISRTSYPLPEAEHSNQRHRPIGIGVQGLADTFAMLRLPFESETAAKLNKAIFETMYFGALQASCELAERFEPYDTFEGSPASRGKLQFDLWDVAPTDRWDWDHLRERIKVHGLRNSLLIAPMPTASTAQILGNTECFEPMTSNLYARRTLAGEFFMLNPHLQRELQNLGLWSRQTRDLIIASSGSVQKLPLLPSWLKRVYKTAWEIKQRSLIDMAADRGAFIDQSQSLNVFLKEPSFSQVSSMHFHAWRRGLKTGMYYLRSQPATEAIKFTLTGNGFTSLEPHGHESAGRSEVEGEGYDVGGPIISKGSSEDQDTEAAQCALRGTLGACEMCGS